MLHHQLVCQAEVENLLPPKHEMKILVSMSEQQKFWAKNLLLRDAKLLAQTENGLVGTGLDHNNPRDTKKEVAHTLI